MWGGGELGEGCGVVMCGGAPRHLISAMAKGLMFKVADTSSLWVCKRRMVRCTPEALRRGCTESCDACPRRVARWSVGEPIVGVRYV